MSTVTLESDLITYFHRKLPDHRISTDPPEPATDKTPGKCHTILINMSDSHSVIYQSCL